jgi:hypothetical protein
MMFCKKVELSGVACESGLIHHGHNDTTQRNKINGLVLRAAATWVAAPERHGYRPSGMTGRAARRRVARASAA